MTDANESPQRPPVLDVFVRDCVDEPEGERRRWTVALAQGEEALRNVAKGSRGPFAVALRSQDGGTAFAAVDRFSVQTLCYRVEGGRILFAQRADDLVAPDEELDPQALFDYLYFHNIPAPRTIFRGIHRLPAGHCVWMANGRLSVRPYWEATFHEPSGTVSFESLKSRFRQLVQEAVARQLDGGIPACFLSGGTDSSTVAGMIGQAIGRAAHTYSIGFEAEGYDEMAFARIAAKRFGTEHREYYLTPDDLVRSIPIVARSYDQPFGNSSALPAYYCALKAHDDGVTKMLAGDGGDELFGGNSRYAKQRIFGWYQHVPAALRRAVMEPLLERTPLGRLPGFSKARSYVEQAKMPMPDRLKIYNLLLRLGVRDVLEPDFLACVDLEEPFQLQREVWSQAQTDLELNRTLAFDWRFTLADSDLPKVCGTAALAGVAVGFPFLDDELVDFSTTLPVEYKLNGLKLRWFFKEALRGFLPDEIITKRKQGFGLPFGVWTTRHSGLRALAVESLGSLARRGFVRPGFIRTLLEHRLPEHPGYYGEMVWVLMMLEQWLQARSVRATDAPRATTAAAC